MSEIRRFSDVRADRGDPQPLPLETLVRAQQLACAGKGMGEIAAELGVAFEDVRRALTPDEMRPRRRG